MSGLRERTKTVDVPNTAGIEGFLHVVREALKLPRVQRVVLEKTGKVTFTQLYSEEQEANLNVSFDHLEPYAVIRNAPLKELAYPPALGGGAVLAAMLDSVCVSGYTPIAFVTAPQTNLWTWMFFGEDVSIESRDTLLGYPLYYDRNIPGTVLVLCAGVDHATALIDTKLSLKIEMQRSQSILDEEMDIA